MIRPAPRPPRGPVLLQVECGTCDFLIEVFTDGLEKILESKQFTCPHCNSMQSIELSSADEAGLRRRAVEFWTSLHVGQVGQPRASTLLPRPRGGNQQDIDVLRARFQEALRQQLSRAPGPQHPRTNPTSAWPSPRANGLPSLQDSHLLWALKLRQDAERLAPRAAFPGSRPPVRTVPLMMPPVGRPPWPPLPPPGKEGDGLDGEDEYDADEGHVLDTFMEYRPAKLQYGTPHPDPVVETASLSAVEPPDVHYELKARAQLVEESRLSALQLEAVVYACQRHEQRLPSGARGGFFIGDGAGVGKGRELAGLIVENWVQGRRMHLWISVGSDLKFDARRDLDDAGGMHIPLHPLNKLPYGKLTGKKIGLKEGVLFLTYSSLVSSDIRGRSRYRQLVEWCGKDFDGLIIFDESHKAKNLVAEGSTKSTQVGLRVQELQMALPSGRVVYCSATGASEPRNMAYMVRLGLWGEGNAGFPAFTGFLEAIQGKGGLRSGASSIAALELVAMDMKSQGMYVCRTLSFSGTEFETVEIPLEEPVASQYEAAARMWNELFREFLYAEEQLIAAEKSLIESNANGRTLNEDSGAPAGEGLTTGATTSDSRLRKTGSFTLSSRGGSVNVNSIWRTFWAAHQRFFRHMCMAAKVPATVRMAHAAVAEGKCVVIGLQSTGEARTADVVAERGYELDDFVSGPKELLTRLVETTYPLPPNPAEADWDSDRDSDDEDFLNETIVQAAARGDLGERGSKPLRPRATVRYKEYGSDEEIGISSSGDEDDHAKNRQGCRGDDDDDDVIVTGSSSDEQDLGKAVAPRSRSASAGPGLADGDDIASLSDDDDGDTQSSDAPDGGVDFDPRRHVMEERQSKRCEETSEERRDRVLAAEMGRMRREHAAAVYLTAVERKEKVKAAVANIELPPNPLDELIDKLGGPSMVAEMTGRKGRLVRDVATGMVRYEARNASGVSQGVTTLEMINVYERKLFLEGQKLIAIISEAASAGISLHADRRVPNQRRRVHLTLELPWSADATIQQFGRSHRANQAHGPEYRLLFTPLGGERRFAAAVARRLQSLGALTQGDRRAGPSLEAFNYESSWGVKALREMYAAVLGERSHPIVIPEPCRYNATGERIPLNRFFGHSRANLLNAGILRHDRSRVSSLDINSFLTSPDGAPPWAGTIDERERNDVARFLNRLLGLAPKDQSQLFDYYQATLDEITSRARHEGTFEEGIVDVQARHIAVHGPPRELKKDPISGAVAALWTFDLDRGLPWEGALEELAKHRVEMEKEKEHDDDDDEVIVENPEAVKIETPTQEVPLSEGERAPVVRRKEEESKEADERRLYETLSESKRPRDDDLKYDGSFASGDITRQGGKRHKTEETRAVVKDPEAGTHDEKKESENNRSGLHEDTKKQAAFDFIDLTASEPLNSGVESKQHADKPSSNGSWVRKELAVPKPALVPPSRESTAPPATGFYRARQAGAGNQVQVMLALKVIGSNPPVYSIYRPGTGRSRKPMAMREMREKYIFLEEEACKSVWRDAYEAAGEAKGNNRAPLRHRKVHLLCGAVMSCWSAVQRAMVRRLKHGERRMKVLRIATSPASTDESPQRFVGMLVPEEAVDDVIAQLDGQNGAL